MAYISCFFVFSIGYGRQLSQFLGFFQQAFWGVPYTEGQNTSGFVEYIKNIAQTSEKIEKDSGFKKLCVERKSAHEYFYQYAEKIKKDM